MKKILLGLVVALVLLAGVVGYGAYSAFADNKPIEDGATYDGRATVVEDVYVSLYLVKVGDGQYVLVDGGVDQKGDVVKAALEKKGVGPNQLEAILLTHGHLDHVGAAYALKDVPVWVHEADVGMVEGRERGKNLLGMLAGKNPPGLKVTRTFKGGDKLTFGDVTFEVFHTPGHTPGNCAFLVDRILLLGDTAQVHKDGSLAPSPEVFSGDPAQAIESIRSLSKVITGRAIKPDLMVGSHAGSTTDIGALIHFSK